MRKKFFIVISVLLVLATCATVFAACNERKQDTESGITIRFVTGFEAQGVIVDPVYATEENPAYLPEDPVYLGSGYVFAGWYYDAEKTQEYDASTPLTQDTVLYAAWRYNGSPSGGKTTNDRTVRDEKGIRYVKLSDETYAVSGYDGDAASLEIPATVKGARVTTVLGGAFDGATFTSVNVPSTVTTIAAGAFGGAELLRNIYVNSSNETYTDKNGVLYLRGGETLVAVGRGRTSFTLPAKVKTIDKYAFAGCFFPLTFPEGSALNAIGEYAFASFAGKITLDGTVKYIAYRAFYEATCEIEFAPSCALTQLAMGEFDGYHGKSLVLPGTIGSISGAPFNGCTATVDFTATGIRSLGESAFAWYKGETLALPYFVEETKNNCFYRCSSKIVFDERSTYETVGTYAFHQFEGEVTFPATVRTVEAYAFYAMKHGTAHFSTAKSALQIDSKAFEACYRPNDPNSPNADYIPNVTYED